MFKIVISFDRSSCNYGAWVSQASLTFLVRKALNLWVSKKIWRTRALFLVFGALAQGIGSTGIGRIAEVDTRAILAILLFLAILVSSTAWQAFATLAYFSPILAIAVALAPWLYWSFHHIEESSFNRFANALDETPEKIKTLMIQLRECAVPAM